MIKNIIGDLLKCKEVNIMCHQVNLDGIMGAGIALQIKNTYPEVFNAYERYVVGSNNSTDLLGTTLMVSTSDKRNVANMFSQDRFSTDYLAFKCCIDTIKKYAEENNLTVGFPKLIGCGIANGSWEIVEELIISTFEDSSVDCYIVEFKR